MNGTETMAYLLAGVLFIRSLGGLSQQQTARAGNWSGIVGMILAVVTTAVVWINRFGVSPSGIGVILGCVLVGGGIGAVMARRVEMTGMPELVAILHSFVGLAAVFVGISGYLSPPHVIESGAALVVHLVEIGLGVAVGAITFTGSIVAWGKLRSTISGRPLLLPARHLLNLALVAGILALGVPFALAEGAAGLPYLLGITGIASLLAFAYASIHFAP